MSHTPSYHPSMGHANLTQSVHYELTPTINSNQDLEESSSILSLSNYLQQDDSSLCFQTSIKPNRHSNQPEKQKMFSEIQCAQKLFMKHMENEFNDQSASEDSESMLLAYSSIKENKFSLLENYDCLQGDKNVTSSIQKEKNSNEHQSLPSRIDPKTSQKGHPMCTDSIELIQLLSIPKEVAFVQGKRASKSQDLIEKQEMAKIEQIYQIINSNKNLFKKINFCETENSSNEASCLNCFNLNKKIQYLQAQLHEKDIEIKKYDSLIEKLNSHIFDLKLQNKQLFFENKQYSTQIQKLLEQRNGKYAIQRIKASNAENLDNSLDKILKESNGVSSSYTNLSRKTTKILENCNKNADSKKMEEVQESYLLYDKKNYPQTPMPSYSQLKKKKSCHYSNQSGKKSRRISISQLKEPMIYHVHEVQTKKSKGLKQNIPEPNTFIDIKSKCSHKSEKNVMRFSDLSKQISAPSNEKNLNQSAKRAYHKPLSLKSPMKAHGFLKVKSKNIEAKNLENLQSHPLNKISQEDNNSEASETKTQKLYGMKKSTKELVQEFTQYNMMSMSRNSLSNHKSLIRNGSEVGKIHEKKQKNSIVYKSFKEINDHSEIQILRQEQRSDKKVSHAKMSFGEYGTQANRKQEIPVYDTLKNLEKSGRNYHSPSPNSMTCKRQNTSKIVETQTNYLKPSRARAQMMSFVR